MMRDETDCILDDLLSRWHSWCRGASYINPIAADPMFRNAKSGRGWDSTDEIIESELTSSTMEAIDFEVGEVAEPHRSALYANARNLASRHTVWSSPRLPADPAARAVLVLEARVMLLKRLVRAGIM